MNKPLLSHEIPKQLFPYHDLINSYSYVLAHLLLKGTEHYDEEYASFYKKKLKTSKLSYLDNACFELGDSIDYKKLYELGEEYKPTHLVLPDCLHDAKVTKERALQYLGEFKSTPKLIGVVQGKTYDEIADMVNFFCDISEVDIIAIPFDIMKVAIPSEFSEEMKKIWRIKVMKECVIPTLKGRKKLHLLGCASVFEFGLYSSYDMENIYSIDTSAPIIYGWSGISLSKCKLETPKPKDKLAENLDIVLSEEQINLITENIHFFRTLFN
mgnify:CR=1 FL=1